MSRAPTSGIKWEVHGLQIIHSSVSFSCVLFHCLFLLSDFWTPRLRLMSLIKSILVSVWPLPAWLKKIKLLGLSDLEEIKHEEVYTAWLTLLLMSVSVTCVWGCCCSILPIKQAPFKPNAKKWFCIYWMDTHRRTPLSTAHFIVTALSFPPSPLIACPASRAPFRLVCLIYCKVTGEAQVTALK